MTKLRRLSAMSRQEIVYRVLEKMHRGTDRVKFHLGVGVEAGNDLSYLLRTNNSSAKSYLHLAAQRFYSAVNPLRQDKIVSLAVQRFPQWIDNAVENAELLMDHRIGLLGFDDIRLGPEINWHSDPTTGFEWPRGYWTKYDLVASRQADPKIIHELNRQQHLPKLAKAFYLTGDERYASEAVTQMESWIDQNPTWNGINWTSSLEIAIRTMSWMWTLVLMLPSRALDERASRRILKSLFSQLHYIHRYPSVYSSPNTHLLGEATALFIGGLLFSELEHAAEWRQFGAGTLVDEMQRQVDNDGVYREMSSYYHCYATDFYLHALVLARVNRFPFPDWMWNRLSHMLEFVLHLSRPDGTIPLIGDEDGGRTLALSARNYRSFRDGLCSAAVLFGRADFKNGAGQFCEETAWLLGDDAWHVFNSLGSEPNGSLGRFYAEGGYFIQRSGWEPQDSHLVFDCGEMGMDTGGHGHADALSVLLFSGGRELLVDSGTSVYNCAPDWRNYFRSTRAHNTVVVDGKDQSEPAGTFSWSGRAPVVLHNHIALPGIEYIAAAHHGYERLQNAVTHTRRVVYVRPNYWIVLDDLRGNGDHEYEFLYHLPPDAQILLFSDERRGEVDCRVNLKESGLQMFLYGSGPVQAAANCGHIEPIQGWTSQQYGTRQPSPVLSAKMRGMGPAAMMTFLVPGLTAARSRQLQIASGRAIAAVLRDQEHDDIAVLCHQDATLRIMDYALRGEFFWIRTENGAIKRLLAVNARSFSNNGDSVFDSDQTIPYVDVHFWETGMVIERSDRNGSQGSDSYIYVRDLRDRELQRD